MSGSCYNMSGSGMNTSELIHFMKSRNVPEDVCNILEGIDARQHAEITFYKPLFYSLCCFDIQS